MYRDLKAGSSPELCKKLNELPPEVEVIGNPYLGSDKQIHALINVPSPTPKKDKTAPKAPAPKKSPAPKAPPAPKKKAAAPKKKAATGKK